MLKTSLILLLSLMASMSVRAQDATTQCEMISALTGDYFAQRQAGKSAEQMEQDMPAPFVNTDFHRTVKLAISLAFTFDKSLNEDQVETQVYESCMRNQP